MVILDFLYRPIYYIGGALNDLFSSFLPGWIVYLLMGLLGIAAVFAVLLPSQLAIIWVERRGIARFQLRPGPNRVGPAGLLQPIADAIKVLTKEPIYPTLIDKVPFVLAPAMAFVPAFMPWAVMPFGPAASFVDLHVGVLYVVSIASISTMSVFMAGWSSANKYALLSSMRTVAQMISYEVPLILSLLTIVLLSGSMSLQGVVEAQGWIFDGKLPFILIPPGTIAFVIFFIAASAELNRTPMDIIEAESELVAGYHTEYSGFMFSLFYLAEYTALLTMSALITTFFLGGWKGPILPPYIWFLIKMWLVVMVFVWTRATLPRLRIDQLMHFAWKFMLPVALANLFLAAVLKFAWTALIG